MEHERDLVGDGVTARFFTALRFLTIVPIRDERAISGEPLWRTFSLFPAVGALIGAVSLLFGYIAGEWFGAPLHAVLAIAAGAVVTGALALDGLADTCDAAFSHRDHDRKLVILEDSRLGTMGAVALLISILTKIGALIALGHAWWIGAFLAPVCGRWSSVFGALRFPVLSEDSVEPPAADRSGEQLPIAAAVALLLAALCIGFKALLLGLFVWLAAELTARALLGVFGGLSADMYNAMSEVGEIAAVLALCALL